MQNSYEYISHLPLTLTFLPVHTDRKNLVDEPNNIVFPPSPQLSFLPVHTDMNPGHRNIYFNFWGMRYVMGVASGIMVGDLLDGRRLIGSYGRKLLEIVVNDLSETVVDNLLEILVDNLLEISYK